MIRAGKVRLLDKQEPKAATLVHTDSEVFVLERDIPWVSRAGLKLNAALTSWDIDVANQVCLDIGASTGGFTDVLLQKGARTVYALDVGHDQLADRLRRDPRVISLEGVNIRSVDPELFSLPPSLITIDVSFISLTLVLPAAVRLLAPAGKVIVLVKPQFEVGKEAIKKGIVRDPVLHERVLRKIERLAAGLGLAPTGTLPSPILGVKGNKEFLVLLEQVSESG